MYTLIWYCSLTQEKHKTVLQKTHQKSIRRATVRGNSQPEQLSLRNTSEFKALLTDQQTEVHAHLYLSTLNTCSKYYWCCSWIVCGGRTRQLWRHCIQIIDKTNSISGWRYSLSLQKLSCSKRTPTHKTATNGSRWPAHGVVRFVYVLWWLQAAGNSRARGEGAAEEAGLREDVGSAHVKTASRKQEWIREASTHNLPA